MSPRRKAPRLASKAARDACDEAGASQETAVVTRRAAAAAQHVPAGGRHGLLDMPTPVLESVFSLLDIESKQSLRQACKLLEAVAQGFPAVWGGSAYLNRGGALQAQLAEGGASAKRSWLQFLRRRVGALHSLRITSSALFAPQVAPVLALSAACPLPVLSCLSLDLHSMTTRQSQRLLKVPRLILCRLAVLSSMPLPRAPAPQSVHPRPAAV